MPFGLKDTSRLICSGARVAKTFRSSFRRGILMPAPLQFRKALMQRSQELTIP